MSSQGNSTGPIIILKMNYLTNDFNGNDLSQMQGLCLHMVLLMTDVILDVIGDFNGDPLIVVC